VRPWYDVGTALDRDDVVVVAPVTGAFSDGSVEHRSLADENLLAHFDTIVDFGGRRLAMASVGGRLVVAAAAYDRHGVAAYDALTGEPLWQRRDLKHGQQVAPAGDVVTVCFDQGPAHVLDAMTGVTVSTLRGVRAYWHSPHAQLGVAGVTGHLSALNGAWRQIWRLPIEGFAVLDAAFSPDAVLASDVVDAGADGPARSSVYCVDLSGRLLWRHESPLLANCPAVGWDATTGEWMAVETNVEGLAEDTLVKWTMDGHMSSRVGLGQRMGTYRFLPSGRRLLSHRGELFETRRAGDIAAR
jgi:hypothetical protein